MSGQAFLVTAHRPEPIVARMVARLAAIGTVLVHVDAEVPIGPFRDLLPDAILLDDRVSVRYPTWSLTQAALRLARHGVGLEGVGRLTLLRSTHYPIVSDERIRDLADDPSDYIAALPAPDARRGKPVSRFTRRAVPARRHGGLAHAVRAGVVNRIRPPLDWTEALGGRELRAGSAYWSLTTSTVVKVLDVVDAGGPMIDYFSRIDSPCESFVHTIVPTVSDHVVPRTISFSEWDGDQHPAPLTRAGLRSAMASGTALFAKKFDVDLAAWVDAELKDAAGAHGEGAGSGRSSGASA